MFRIPASYLRGLAVLAVGASFVLAHAAPAASSTGAAKLTARTQLDLAVSPVGAAGRQQREAMDLAENCYLEVQEDLTPQGRTLSQIVHECD
jgi:hypothetical protein